MRKLIIEKKIFFNNDEWCTIRSRIFADFLFHVVFKTALNRSKIKVLQWPGLHAPS